MSATDIDIPGEEAGPTDGTETPTDAPDADASGGTDIMSRLLSTYEPDRRPPELQSEYEVPKGVALVLYGILQMAETGGMPAIGNVALGAMLEVRSRDLGGDDSDDGPTDPNDEFDITEVSPE